MSMECIPVQCALLLSPVWRQDGRSSESIWRLKARADAHQALYHPGRPTTSASLRWSSASSISSAPSTPSSLSSSPSRPFLKQLFDQLHLPTSERRSVGQLLSQHAYQPLTVRRWASLLGALWVADLGLMLYFYITQVWDNETYEFLSAECDSLTAVSEQGVKVASLVLIGVSLVLAIWQWVGVIFPHLSAPEVLGGLLDFRWRAQVADGAGGQTEWRLDHPWRVQALAVTLAFLGWLATTLFFFFQASGAGGFLLAGDDPFTASQIGKMVATIPFVMSAVRGYRGLLFDRQKQEVLKAKHPAEFEKALKRLVASEVEPIRPSVYDSVGKQSHRRGQGERGLAYAAEQGGARGSVERSRGRSPTRRPDRTRIDHIA